MTDRSITIEHGGETYTGQIMKIESTMLGGEDHGIFTCYLHCKGDGIGVGVGGFGMDAPIKGEDGRFSHREGTAYGLDLVLQILRTVGVSSWERLTGQHVIVLFKGRSLLGGSSTGIASLVDDRVLILKDHAAKWKAREDERAFAVDVEATR